MILQRLQYVVDFINHHPLNGFNVRFTLQDNGNYDKAIIYGKRMSDKDLFVPAQSIFFCKDQESYKDLFINKYSFLDENIYSVEAKETNNSEAFFKDSHYGFDVFETVFFHISRYEEFYCDHKALDNMGMVQQHELLLAKAKIVQIPVIDHLIKNLLLSVGYQFDDKPTEFVLTHDIDKIFKYNSVTDGIKAFGWPIVYKTDPVSAFRNLNSFLQVRRGRLSDPYDSYSYLFKSSKIWSEKVIYFMAGGKSRYDLFDKHYERDIDLVFNLASKFGYKIGIHPSFETSDNEDLWLQEKDWLEGRLKLDIEYSRQHFLHFHLNKTPSIIDNNRMKKDSTLGYSRWIGFRSGTGFDHHLYDFKNEKAYSFLETPLVIMDSSLIHQVKGNIQLFRMELEAFIAQNLSNTRICLNFHNSTFDYTVRERKELKTLYQGLEEVIEQIL